MAVDEMIDVAFAVEGGCLPREHRRALADAIESALPWLAETPDVGVHPLKSARGGGSEVLLSPRSRLVLRLPRERADDAEALAGQELLFGGWRLSLGAAHRRELLPWGTLYAHCVAATEGDDEIGFLCAVQAELDVLGIAGRVITGLAQRGPGGAVRGYSVMIDGLAADDSLALQRHGIGAGRRLGYGLFVPHKSAAAVGAPA